MIWDAPENGPHGGEIAMMEVKQDSFDTAD